MKKSVCKPVSLFLIMALVLSSIPVLAVSQEEIDDLESQRDELRSRQDEVQQLIDSLENNINSLLEKKSALDEQSELLRQDILLLQQQIELYDAMVLEKREDAEAAKIREQEHYELYCHRVRSMEENSTWSFILFIISAANFSEFISRIIDVADIMSYDQELRTEYLAACEEAEKALTEYVAVLEAQKLKKSELEEQEKNLAEKIASSARLIAQLEEDAESYKAYWDSVDAELAEVQALIDKKAEELRKQQEAEAAQNQTPGYTGGSVTVSGGYYTWPSYCSYVSSPFGPRTHPIYGQLKPHTGVDIAAAYGTAITAAASGVVTLAVLDYGSVGYGTYVAIYHPNGTTTLYAHMSALAVSAGQTVSQGQVIGYVGSTGASTGPHIHFEIRVDGACVDPMQFF